MGKIGNWGKAIKFRTSDSKILTFRDFRRTASAKVSYHEPIGNQTRTEYLGRKPQEITFTMELRALDGVRPRAMEEKLISKVGQHELLVIGNRRIARTMLLEVSSAYDVVLDKGKVASMKVDVKMEEYH